MTARLVSFSFEFDSVVASSTGAVDETAGRNDELSSLAVHSRDGTLVERSAMLPVVLGCCCADDAVEASALVFDAGAGASDCDISVSVVALVWRSSLLLVDLTEAACGRDVVAGAVLSAVDVAEAADDGVIGCDVESWGAEVATLARRASACCRVVVPAVAAWLGADVSVC